MSMFSFFLITANFFLFRLKVKCPKNDGAKVFLVACVFPRIITFCDTVFLVFLSLDQNFSSLKYESDIVFSAFLLLDKSFMKLYLINSFNTNSHKTSF